MTPSAISLYQSEISNGNKNHAQSISSSRGHGCCERAHQRESSMFLCQRYNHQSVSFEDIQQQGWSKILPLSYIFGILIVPVKLQPIQFSVCENDSSWHSAPIYHVREKLATQLVHTSLVTVNSGNHAHSRVHSYNLQLYIKQSSLGYVILLPSFCNFLFGYCPGMPIKIFAQREYFASLLLLLCILYVHCRQGTYCKLEGTFLQHMPTEGMNCQ